MHASALFKPFSLGLLLWAALSAPAVAQSTSKAPPASSQALQARLAEVQANPILLENALKIGAATARFCANCHGPKGNSRLPETPNLAGQNPAYLLDQIALLSEGKRKHEFMQKLMRALDTDEKVGVALYVAQQAVTTTVRPTPDKAAQLAKGKAYYAQACASCHGEKGMGSETLARVAGQQAPYMTLTLKRYRAGTGDRLDATMATFAKQMSDADIHAVANYLATLGD